MTAEIENQTASKEASRTRELPQTLQPLEKLAWNYWWSWAPDGPDVFRDVDPGLWAQCEQNPRVLLARVSDLRLAQVAAEPVFSERVQKLGQRFDAYIAHQEPWPKLQLASGVTRQNPIAYFCAEYGVHNSLPLYSGGLGILAGDHLKSASDLNVPLVAVGLFYRFGYFRQRLNLGGWQEESYRENYADELPLELVKDAEQQPILIEMAMRGRTVRACAWRVSVGRIQLYLLDTNIPENGETDRLVTGHLYGGDRETRMVQEKMLGIGGVRLLRKLGIEPSVFHLNEGHSAFLTLELARELVEKEGLNFAAAADRVREHCVFTTHTPVAAGHDEFSTDLIDKGFGNWYESALGLSRDQFLALGRVNGEARESFGLTPLALRMCRSINGVSQKHGEISRKLWQKMWPDRSEAPISSVTNGVHSGTWVAPLLRRLYEQRVGDDWIGFARRVAGYKRWNLLLGEPDRITRLTNDPERPIQFVFAGKAHPQDQEAKLILQRLIEWQRDPSIRQRVAFIEDYDQEIARQLVQGVDVWMNVPRRPLEASGTSGEKAAINGALNFSVLDGWWLEGYDGNNGFAIGDLDESNDEEMDRLDAESMYRVLEEEIIPLFYERDERGIPQRWIAMIKRSIQTLVPKFSSDRMVAEYAERIY